ncbi:energy transducer TonB [Noviherbaspirillum saxi]|uniref:Energy transducer TonB n=2 Tax=Noviherbaspirillum saxi TaxID=2320863 RepID=A0A3A3FML3_9BURK|nr:energy transducer TonB [Noviherbaspirillum saxi]
MSAQAHNTIEPVVLRLETRTIEIPSPSLPEPPTSVTTPPAPLPAAATSVKRNAQVPAQKPMLAAVPSAEPVSPMFPAAPTAPSSEAGLPAAPGPAATPAPAPVVVQGPRFDADYLQNPAPAYPSISRRKREEGKVLLQVRVSTAGLPEQIQIKQSSGIPRLDEAAVDTVQRWRFVPARRGEETVAANVMVPIVFRLEG